MHPIHTAVTHDSLTVYWDQPVKAGPGQAYAVALDGADGLRTSVTHHTFRGLAPGTEHRVAVFLGDALLGEARARTAPPRRPIDVTRPPYGAAGDGKTPDTAALQRAIDACGPDEEVYLPAGTYLTGGLRLHGDMALRLDEGAVLLGSDRPEDYLPKLKSRFEGVEQLCYQSLLNLGELDHDGPANCGNVLIYGGGTIRGGGQRLARRIIAAEREALKDALAAMGDKIKECENDDTIPGRARGRLINLSNCDGVRITGLRLEDGASWNVHMVYSRNILTDHCAFRSTGVWNGDGWDPDSSERCTLFASTFDTEDDSVAIKSGKNPEGNRINRPTRHIRVFDCASRYGLGIAIGSEMSGGVEDVRIWDCDLRHSLYGVQIKATRKRGGFVRDVHVSDCVLPRFLVCAVAYNDDGEGAPVPPVFGDIHCRRVHFTGWARNYWEKEDHRLPCVDLSGFDVPGHAARGITFDDCTAEGEAQVRLVACEEIRLDLRSVSGGETRA